MLDNHLKHKRDVRLLSKMLVACCRLAMQRINARKRLARAPQLQFWLQFALVQASP
jgi:hypothetical protein